MEKISAKEKVVKFWRKEAKPLLIMVLVLFAFRSAIADWNDVPTGSMKPTIIEGDRVFVNKLAYDLKFPFTTWHMVQWDDPKRGDIVVFFSPADGIRLVKRVIGVPGDKIQLKDNKLYVNGQEAKYDDLDPKIINEIPSGEQPSHTFARETVQNKSHAVMTTFGLTGAPNTEPLTVPEGHYFMMGDNRDNSFDSRFYGCVDRKAIVGRATAVVISLDHQSHFSPRWHRFFSKLH
jgi:signal peptidase I